MSIPVQQLNKAGVIPILNLGLHGTRSAYPANFIGPFTMIYSHQPQADVGSKHPQPTVLVVEDDPCQRQVVLRMLAGLGVQADCADNALRAWQRLEQGSYDLVLLDIELPDANGTAIADQIRSRPGHRPIVIGFSALADRNLPDACRLAGMKAFFPKPITPETLRFCLKAI